jgi:hypothetical protein
VTLSAERLSTLILASQFSIVGLFNDLNFSVVVPETVGDRLNLSILLGTRKILVS